MHWLLLTKVLINTPVFHLLMNHLLMFCEGSLGQKRSAKICLKCVSGGGKARRLQYATNERDKLHDCMIVCLYSTWKKHLAMPAWNEALTNAIYTAQGNVGKDVCQLAQVRTFGECQCPSDCGQERISPKDRRELLIYPFY